MASAASVKTLVSLKAFKCAPLLRVSGDAPTRSSCLPAPALPGSGSAGRLQPFRSFCPLSLAAPRLFVPLVYLNPAPPATPLFPQKPEHRRRVRDAPVPDHRKGLPERHLHHPDKLRRLRRGPPPVLPPPPPPPPPRPPPPLSPAARQLERELAQRLPPLAHEDHLALPRHGDHGGEPAALQDAVLDGLPARQLHPVHPERAPRAPVDVLPPKRPPTPVLHAPEYIPVVCIILLHGRVNIEQDAWYRDRG